MVYKNLKIDLNKSPAFLSCNDEFDMDGHFHDTALRLECFGHGTISRAKRDAKSAQDDGCRLVLGLGATPSANERDLVLRLGLSQHFVTSKSDQSQFSKNQSASIEVRNGFGCHHVVDEGCTSVKRSGGYMPSLLLAPRISVPLQKLKISEPEPSLVSDFSTETASDYQTRGKKCMFSSSQAEYGRAHGSGKRCSHSTGCSKAARGKSGLCKAHGGGKRCLYEAVQETEENKNGFLGIRPKLFHVSCPGPGPRSPDNPSLSCPSAVTAVSNSTSWLGKPLKRRQLIPPQVLVPPSMKSSSFLQLTKQWSSETDNNCGPKSLGLVVPEGQVHNGSLFLLADGKLNEGVIDWI